MNAKVHANQISRAERFRALHLAGKPLLLPNVWDGMSAAALVAAGFPAIATTSSGIAWSLGFPDGEHMSPVEMIAAIERIARIAGNVPLSADIEAGYAHTDEELAGTIAAVISAGAIGINLEDSLPGSHTHQRSVEEAAHRIRVVRRASQRMNLPLFINARADVYLSESDDAHARDQEALTRCKAYLAAGADCVFPIGLFDAEKLRVLVNELKAPVNAMQSQGRTTYEMFCAAQVARVSMASTLVLTSFDHLNKVAQELAEPSRFAAMRAESNYLQMQKIFESKSVAE